MTRIWVDFNDDDMFHLGVDTKQGWCCWASIHVDGLADLFGLSGDDIQRIREHNSYPIKIVFKARIQA